MKITSLLLSAILALQFTACSNTNDKGADADVQTEQTQVKEEETMTEEKRDIILSNTYSKLTEDKELTIVYIGGSVTDGYGSTNQSQNAWAAHLGNRIKELYPDVKLNNQKKSIGGTGSYFASFRYEREIAPLNPDLLFIEYAINDKYNGVTYDQVVKSSESIVRLANKFNPAIDIIFVLTFDSGTKDSDYDQLRAHRDVAEYYGYPVLKMADKVYAMLEETGEDYSVYFKDGVHPNDAGYAFYGEQVIALVEEELKTAEEAAAGYADHVLPEKTLADYVTLDANMIYADEIDLSDSEGWEYQPKTNFSWLGTRYNGRIFAKEIGAKLTFEFEGTDIGLATGIGPKMGIISVTVDDREPVIIDEYRTSPNPKDRVIAEGLEDTKHTVTIEVIGQNEKSEGCEFEIGAILIN
ncbi:MAG: hypothetical protein E7583_02155 [Ruminococcaceae bacterium]|nr:hypothetical protein [Oscillospiraceae bacterium]